MASEYGRLALYAVGSAFSLLTAGRLIVLKQRLALLFALVMLGWAINCMWMFTLLAYFLITGISRPDWSGPIFLLNALLLAVAPALLYALFPGQED